MLAVLAVRSDEEVEHFSDLWLEVVVLDSLVEHIVDSDIDPKFSWESFYGRGTPERAAQLPLLDAPPTEAELFALLDLSVAEVEMANSEALEGGLPAPCTSVVASMSAAAAWAAGLPTPYFRLHLDADPSSPDPTVRSARSPGDH